MPVPHLGELDLVWRLALTALLCGLIGLERESRDQAAGMRTHMLVGLGSALFTLVSAYGFADVVSLGANGTPVLRDPTRIAAQVASGIGFLGAGAILRQGVTVRGLTTASTLWLTAAVGMAVAAGFELGATLCTVMGLMTLVGMRWLRGHIMPRLRSDWVLLEVRIADHKGLGRITQLLLDHGITIRGMDDQGETGGGQTVRFELVLPPQLDTAALLAEIDAQPKVLGWEADGFHVDERPEAAETPAEPQPQPEPESPAKPE